MPGSTALDLFTNMQKEGTLKTGFFKRQSYLTARVGVRARRQKITMQCEFDDADAYTPDPDNKRAAYTTVMRGDIPNPAEDMLADALPNGLSSSDLARYFMQISTHGTPTPSLSVTSKTAKQVGTNGEATTI